MKALQVVAPGALVVALSLSGCDKVTNDLTTPWPVQGPSANSAHLEPGMWRAVPPRESAAGCSYSLLRNNQPVVWAEVRDSVPVFAYLPQSTADTTWSFTTVGCGTWEVMR